MTNQEIIKEATQIIKLNSKDPKDPKYAKGYEWALNVMPSLINHLTYDLSLAEKTIKELKDKLEYHNLSI